MKTKKVTIVEIILIICMIVFVITWTFLGRDKNNNKQSVNVLTKNKIIEITDDIHSDTVWRKGSIYMIKTKNFHVNKKLTIEPGVVIRFIPNAESDQTIVLKD